MIAINRFLTYHSNGLPVVLTVLPQKVLATKNARFSRLLRRVSIGNIEPRRMKSV